MVVISQAYDVSIVKLTKIRNQMVSIIFPVIRAFGYDPPPLVLAYWLVLAVA